jgi:hypothetical protein
VKENGWIVSPAVDLLLFVGVTLTTLGPWIASDWFHVPGWYVLIGVALFNGGHLISTWTRVYLPRSERFRRPIHYWLIPGLLASFAIASNAIQALGPAVVRTVIFYWASWHFVAQSWGIHKIYQRKHGAVGTTAATLEKVLIFLPALWCVMHRLYTGPWELFGSYIFHPTLRAWMVNGVGALTVGFAVVYLARSARQPVPLIRPLYLGFNALGFVMPYLVIKDGTSAFAAAALWHAIQYVAIVWLYNRRRWADGIDADARLISWASQPGHELAYLGVLALCAAGVYFSAFLVAHFSKTNFQLFAMTLWTALTLGHYWVDGVIWKFKKYDLKPLTATGGLSVPIPGEVRTRHGRRVSPLSRS